MNILITNDDGIESVGILALQKILSKKFTVFLAAPKKERSATSMALSIFDRLHVEKLSANSFVVDGFPVDCVNLSLHGKLFPHIDMVVSGINRGVNMGEDVHYSGTVGAAKHGAIHGRLAFALSSGARLDSDYEKEAVAFLKILETKMDKFKLGVVYNINFPPVFQEDILKITRLGKRKYYDDYEIKKISETSSEYFLGGSDLGREILPDTDFEAYELGFISISPVALDVTDTLEYQELKKRML
ncbi:MAG: 5'/3'-nucleotidase SurE [Leptospiraceae bacterium]|nr:5'/3'-nucleotidase SurE [Leptospiraceae bacterium]